MSSQATEIARAGFTRGAAAALVRDRFSRAVSPPLARGHEMGDQLNDLRISIGRLGDEELQEMVGRKSADYRPEALTLARDELTRRGIAAAPAVPLPPDAAAVGSRTESPPRRGLATEYLLIILLAAVSVANRRLNLDRNHSILLDIAVLAGTAIAIAMIVVKQVRKRRLARSGE